MGADGFFALAAPFFFFCAGDAAAAGVVEAAGAAALALAFCLVSEEGGAALTRGGGILARGARAVYRRPGHERRCTRHRRRGCIGDEDENGAAPRGRAAATRARTLDVVFL